MRQITKPELERILQEHQLWLESGCVKGARAYLHGVDLREANLLRADLREANLQVTDLRGVDLQGVDLQGAHLQLADMRGAQFDVNIRHCRSFERAVFTADALPWLVLHPRWSEWKGDVRIEEATE